MAQQNINIGSVANDGTGDSLRVAAIKINGNFVELYDLLASLPQVAYTGDYNDLLNKPVGVGGGGAVDSVNGKTGEVVLTKSDLGLGAYPNDPAELQISPTDLTDIYLELDTKADKVNIPTVPVYGTMGWSISQTNSADEVLTLLGFQSLPEEYYDGPIGLDQGGNTKIWSWGEVSKKITDSLYLSDNEVEVSGDFSLENIEEGLVGWKVTMVGNANLHSITGQTLKEGAEFKILLVKMGGSGSYTLTVEPEDLLADPPIEGFIFANELEINEGVGEYTAFLIGKLAGKNRIWNFPLEYVA